MWLALYPFMALAELLFTLFVVLFVNWWAPLFATADARLPHWLAWVDTFDDDLDTGHRFGLVTAKSVHWRRVQWLNRNPAYGFSYWVLGCAFNPDDWTITNPDWDNFAAVSKDGRFNRYGKLGPIRYKLGWKARNYRMEVEQVWRTAPWGPVWRTQFVFSIRKA